MSESESRVDNIWTKRLLSCPFRNLGFFLGTCSGVKERSLIDLFRNLGCSEKFVGVTGSLFKPSLFDIDGRAFGPLLLMFLERLSSFWAFSISPSIYISMSALSRLSSSEPICLLCISPFFFLFLFSVLADAMVPTALAYPRSDGLVDSVKPRKCENARKARLTWGNIAQQLERLWAVPLNCLESLRRPQLCLKTAMPSLADTKFHTIPWTSFGNHFGPWDHPRIQEGMLLSSTAVLELCCLPPFFLKTCHIADLYAIFHNV